MDLQDYKSFNLQLDGGWLRVSFNEPEIRNALTNARAADLRALCAELEDRRDIRGVTFRGEGGTFCAGGDLKSFQTALQGGAKREDVIDLSLSGADLFDAVNALPQVTVMAVEGPAMAGGFGLVCCGDVVIADANAKFAFSETKIGLTPAQISPFVLQRLGARIGRKLMLTAATLDGKQAEAIGLADEITDGPDAMSEAIARIAAQVRKSAPDAIANTKRLILAMPKLHREAQKRAAAESFADAMLSDEGREGVMSFVQKRKPSWAE